MDMPLNYVFLELENGGDKLPPEEEKKLRRYRRLSIAKKKHIIDELREFAGKTGENELKIRG